MSTTSADANASCTVRLPPQEMRFQVRDIISTMTTSGLIASADVQDDRRPKLTSLNICFPITESVKKELREHMSQNL